jgi:Skp family chaperone for outer membrane proteins
MKKRGVILWVSLSLLLWGANEAKGVGPKLYSVNLAEAFEKYYKAKEAREGFEVLVKNAEKETEAMMGEGSQIIDKIQELQKKLDNAALDETAKGKIKTDLEEQYKLLQKKEKDINEFRGQTDMKLAQKKQMLILEHLEDIKRHVAEIAKQKEADMVLNEAGTGLVYVKPEYDLTEEVVRAINRGNPKSEGKKNDSK